MRLFLLVACFIPVILNAQSRKEKKALEARQKVEQQLINEFQQHLTNLSVAYNNTSPADAFDRAKAYLVSEFSKLHLLPYNATGYEQPFTINLGKRVTPNTSLSINGNLLSTNEYYPLAYSPNRKVSGMPAISLKEKGVPWFLDVKDRLGNGASVGEVQSAIRREADRAAVKGATALFVYNSGSIADSISFNTGDTSGLAAIPVVYITAESSGKYLADPAAMLDVEMNVEIEPRTVTAIKLAAYYNNNAANTVVVTSGYGCRTDASVSCANGPAVLLGMAKMLTESALKKNNYLFVAFDETEVGDKQSLWVSDHLPTANINYVVNISRALKGLEKPKVSGLTTSNSWSTLFETANVKALAPEVDSTFDNVVASSPFFVKAIPVLNIYQPEASTAVNSFGTVKLVYNLIEGSNEKDKFLFVNSAGSQLKNSSASTGVEERIAFQSMPAPLPRAEVSLGIIADKPVPAQGLRINGVSPKKLAARIGLQSGDILVNLGGNRIVDMNSYLKALANFKLGDKTVLVIKRGSDDKEFAVEF